MRGAEGLIWDSIGMWEGRGHRSLESHPPDNDTSVAEVV